MYGDVAIACTRKTCRKWRWVPGEWVDEQNNDPGFLFYCGLHNKRCRGKCDECSKVECECECPECKKIGLRCTCPSVND